MSTQTTSTTPARRRTTEADEPNLLTKLARPFLINEVSTGSTPAYPEVVPHFYDAEPAEVRHIVLAFVRDADQWSLASDHASPQGAIRAERRTKTVGFVDDVTIWVRPDESGARTRIDIRSASRLGIGDFGQNAKNIQEVFDALSPLSS